MSKASNLIKERISRYDPGDSGDHRNDPRWPLAIKLAEGLEQINKILGSKVFRGRFEAVPKTDPAPDIYDTVILPGRLHPHIKGRLVHSNSLVVEFGMNSLVEADAVIELDKAWSLTSQECIALANFLRDSEKYIRQINLIAKSLPKPSEFKK